MRRSRSPRPVSSPRPFARVSLAEFMRRCGSRTSRGYGWRWWVRHRDPCVYCGAYGGRRRSTIEHVIPRAAGGHTGFGDPDPLILVRTKPAATIPERGYPLGNLVSACGVCNRTRSDRPLLMHLIRLRRRGRI